MSEQIFDTPSTKKTTPFSRKVTFLILIAVFGSTILGATVGYRFGVQQIKQHCENAFVYQPVPTPVPSSESETNPTATPTPSQIWKSVDEVTGWNIYTDDAAGFTLKYPPNVGLEGQEDVEGLTLTIYSKWVEDYVFDGLDREDVIKDVMALSKGDFGASIDWPLEASRNVRRIDNLYAKEFVVLIRFSTDDVAFDRKLIFYNNGYQVVIKLSGVKDDIISSMPSYFKTVEEAVYESEQTVWDLEKMDEFYQALVGGMGSAVAQEWYDAFDEIVGTLVIE